MLIETTKQHVSKVDFRTLSRSKLRWEASILPLRRRFFSRKCSLSVFSTNRGFVSKWDGLKLGGFRDPKITSSVFAHLPFHVWQIDKCDRSPHFPPKIAHMSVNNTYMVSAGIIERKLRRTKVRLFTVPCCSIILFSSEGMKKNVSDLPPNVFRRFYNSCRSAVVL